MKTIARGIQFVLIGICLSVKLIISIFLKLYIFLIGITLFFIIIAALFGADSWRLLWRFLFLGFQIFMAGFLIDFINNWIGKIFGSLLNEKQEDKNIYEEYEKQFFNQYERSGYNYQRTEYSNYSGYSEYKEYNSYSGNKDNIIKKYEEYLKYFGVDTEVKVTLEIIKKAYKTKIKEVHPDRNPGKDTTAETAKVNEIKEFLDMNLEYYLMKRGF